MGRFRKLLRVGPWNQDPFKEQENLGLRVGLSFWFQGLTARPEATTCLDLQRDPEPPRVVSTPPGSYLSLSPSMGRSLLSDGHGQTVASDPGGPVRDTSS